MPFIKNVAIFAKKIVSISIPFGKLSGGTYNANYINTSGKTWGWGYNQSGQLGDNTRTSRLTPVSVVGTTKTFCKIIAHGSQEQFVHTLAIDKNGRIWAWGANTRGQLGDNTTVSQLTPVSILGATKTFCEIAAGALHSLAIDKNGRAWAWGDNASGKLGDNTTVSKLTPVSILGATKTFCKITVGTGHSAAIDKNGQVWSWGLNTSGQLGNNSTVSQLTPVSILGATKTFCQIDSGTCHTLAIDKNGRLWAWGAGGSFQLGDNNSVSRLTPVSVLGTVKTFCKISAGWDYSLAIDKNGQVWAWGRNGEGQIGNNIVNFGTARTPLSIRGVVKTFCEIFAAGLTAFAIDKDKKVWSWGDNTYGQIGNNTESSQITPVSIAGGVKTFCKIYSAGGGSAIDKNGQVWSWGRNISGDLGDNTILDRCTPVSLLGATKTFCKIAEGVAIDKNGRAWSWGEGLFGRLGDNTTVSKRTPVSILGATKTFCEISAGSFHRNAIDKNGKVWSWGLNGSGQLGNNSTVSQLTPVSILGATKTFCKISTYAPHVLAIDKNGQVWAWGDNTFGQLGDNTTVSKLTPVSILGATKTFCQIATGGSHSAAIDKNGRLWAWGYNILGQLGDTTQLSRLTPVSVRGVVKTFCQIYAGANHSLAIDKNGRLWAWGDNANGKLGDNTVASKRTPVSVGGVVKTFCQIAAGGSHSFAIDKNGRAWVWGRRVNFLLGDGYNTRTPIQVCNL